jgi:hypothetical protein
MEAFSQRLLDVVDEGDSCPIVGLKDTPTLTFVDCITWAQDHDPILKEMNFLAGAMFCAEMKAKKIQDTESVLSRDEVAAIHLYTQQTPWFVVLNKRLRDRNRDNLKCLFPYLRLLLTALYKLPAVSVRAFRGVKRALSVSYKAGECHVWWSIGSAALRADVLQNESFLGKSGERTMFSLDISSGVDTRKYSAHDESEVIIIPGTCFRVESVLDLGSRCHMVQMTEQDIPSLVDLPRPAKTMPEPSTSKSMQHVQSPICHSCENHPHWRPLLPRHQLALHPQIKTLDSLPKPLLSLTSKDYTR